MRLGDRVDAIGLEPVVGVGPVGNAPEDERHQRGVVGRGDVGINVNGQRQDNNNYLLDGISVTDLRNSELFNTPLPSPDAVQEFKVQTSLYDATEGRNGGGNINAVLKSGTSRWHGSAFEFFRNDVFNANEFFQERNGQPRPEVKQNLFGGSIGGPLGLEAKGGYLFVNYQGIRQKSGLSTGAIISAVLPVLPSDRSAASLSMAGFGNAFTPIDPVVLALLNVKSNQFGGAGRGWLIPSLPPTFDRTNRLVLSYDYALPFLAHTHGWQSAVLGPWSVSGITVFQSGLPFRITDSAGASAYGTPTPNTATPSLAPGYTLSSALTSG